MKEVKSPITLDDNVVSVDDIDVKRIIKQYKTEIKIDVTKYFKDIEKITIYKCIETGYRFYYPVDCIGNDKFYEELSKTRKGYYSNRWEHKVALNEIKQNESVLEVGSGSGFFLKSLQERKINATGLEFNPFAIKECQKTGLNVTGELVQDHVKTKSNYYDVICAFQVLEHIADVHSFLQACNGLVKKNGRLIFGVPNNNPYLFIIDKYHTLNLPPHHAGLWDKSSLKNLEKLFPLKLEKILFEPLDSNYSYFLKIHLDDNPNIINRMVMRYSNRFFPGLLKKLILKFVNGRNILVVFRRF